MDTDLIDRVICAVAEDFLRGERNIVIPPRLFLEILQSDSFNRRNPRKLDVKADEVYMHKISFTTITVYTLTDHPIYDLDDTIADS